MSKFLKTEIHAAIDRTELEKFQGELKVANLQHCPESRFGAAHIPLMIFR